MAPHDPHHVIIVGAGAAGLMAGQDLVRAGLRVTILEARDRCGGRIWALPAAEFGYAAEGGAEFVHGAAPVTAELVRAAGLSLVPVSGTAWDAEDGRLLPDGRAPPPHMAELRAALKELHSDLPIADFLDRHFVGDEYDDTRRSILRRVEGYDVADPSRVSTFAIRDEWLGEGEIGGARRIFEGYGALIDLLAAECRRGGGAIRLGARVTAIETTGSGVAVRLAGGDAVAGDAAIVTVPMPLLADLALPAPVRAPVAAAVADIGYGNVVKLLLCFRTRWWTERRDVGLKDLSFVFSDTAIPTWWTQHPAVHPVLTGWLGGPKAEKVSELSEHELIERGIGCLATIFGRPATDLRAELVAARAIDWSKDPFARGAYSYATPRTAAAKAVLKPRAGDPVLFCGEAFYAGREAATVEAALASGREAAEAVIGTSGDKSRDRGTVRYRR